MIGAGQGDVDVVAGQFPVHAKKTLDSLESHRLFFTEVENP